jgi:ribosomal protein S18 acetylase RimI-like enzyme
MVYSGLAIPVLFAIGPSGSVASLLDELNGQRQYYLLIKPEILPLIRARFHISHETAMWRMVLDPARFTQPDTDAVRLSLADYPALLRLHADGAAAGEAPDEAPDFFAPSMVEQGVFYGLYEGSELVAAAGTHIVAPGEGVAAVGNVYTRRDRRGRGLARQVTGAVTAELLQRLPDDAVIALNVIQANAPAVSVYRRLGYVAYCEFYEGLAERPGDWGRLV